MSLEVREESTNEYLRYRLVGKVADHATFPPFRSAPLVYIHLGDVTSLNSIGIRSWCEWVAQAEPSTKIILEEVPFMFGKAFNNVMMAFTPQMRVKSFFVPYFNEDTGYMQNVLVNRDEVFATGSVVLPTLRGPEGEELEIDVASDFFRFAK